MLHHVAFNKTLPTTSYKLQATFAEHTLDLQHFPMHKERNRIIRKLGRNLSNHRQQSNLPYSFVDFLVP